MHKPRNLFRAKTAQKEFRVSVFALFLCASCYRIFILQQPLLSEELSAASLCKGLSAERRRTSCTEVRIDRFDLLYLIGMLLAAVALIFFDRFAKGGFSL